MKPELRFPEFNEEWEEQSLDNIVFVNSGKDYKHLKQGSYPVYGTGGYISSVSDYLCDDLAIGIGRKGTINKPYLLIPPFWTVDTLFYCTSKNNNDTLFLLNLFKKINWKKYDESTGVPSLSKATIKKIKKFIPKQIEQQKIGDFFSKIDRQIELEEKKIEQLEAQKKGYMQRIFSQELRFKDENGNDYPEWEEKKIGDIAKIQNGYAFKSSLFVKAGLSILRISDITNSVVKKGTVYYPENIDIPKRFKIYKGDILIAMSGATTGKIGMYIDKEESMLNQRVGKFIPTKDTDNNFLYVYLSSAQFRQSLLSLLVAGAQPNVSTKDLENITLDVPSYTEQQQIGYFFNKFDVLINNKKQKLNLLKQRKQGFLQKMFV